MYILCFESRNGMLSFIVFESYLLDMFLVVPKYYSLSTYSLSPLFSFLRIAISVFLIGKYFGIPANTMRTCVCTCTCICACVCVPYHLVYTFESYRLIWSIHSCIYMYMHIYICTCHNECVFLCGIRCSVVCSACFESSRERLSKRAYFLRRRVFVLSQ